MSSEISEYMYRRFKKTQRELGMARFELGTLLEVFKNNDSLWKGRAQSFHSFLEEERISPDGARSFMRVARKYVLELGLGEDVLSELACVNFRILDMAAKHINKENMEEMLSVIVALGERDARVELENFATTVDVEKDHSEHPKQVLDLLRRYHSLPDDYRLVFMSCFNRSSVKEARS